MRADDYLAGRSLTVGTTVDAKKTKIGPAEALALARSMKRLVAARGAKITTLDLAKDAPSDETLLALLIGNTGNLRAPTFKVGTTLLVGFNPDAYDAVFR